MITDFGKFVVGIFIIVFFYNVVMGALHLRLTYAEYKKAENIIKRGIIVEATVMKFNKFRIQKARNRHRGLSELRPVLSYTYNGETYNEEFINTLPDMDLTVGSKINIYIDQENPWLMIRNSLHDKLSFCAHELFSVIINLFFVLLLGYVLIKVPREYFIFYLEYFSKKISLW